MYIRDAQGNLAAELYKGVKANTVSLALEPGRYSVVIDDGRSLWRGNVEVRPGVQNELSAKFAASPRLGIGVVIPMRPRTEAVVRASWSPSSLQAQDDTGTRDVADVGIFEAVFGVRSRVWRALELSGGFGGLYFDGGGVGPFSEGADIAPVLEGGIGTAVERGGHRFHVRGIAQLHRFTTEALQSARVSGGSVIRYGIETSLTWKGGAR